MGDFYGTGIEIWAGFRLIGSTEKQGSGGNYEHFLRVLFFMFSGAKRNIKKK